MFVKGRGDGGGGGKVALFILVRADDTIAMAVEAVDGVKAG